MTMNKHIAMAIAGLAVFGVVATGCKDKKPPQMPPPTAEEIAQYQADATKFLTELAALRTMEERAKYIESNPKGMEAVMMTPDPRLQMTLDQLMSGQDLQQQ